MRVFGQPKIQGSLGREFNGSNIYFKKRHEGLGGGYCENQSVTFNQIYNVRKYDYILLLNANVYHSAPKELNVTFLVVL